MKQLILVCLVVFLGGILSAQTDPQWLWASRAGGTLDDYGYSVAVDAAGNSFVAGHFQNTADFGGTNITSAGNYDIFVAKLDPAGNWLWAKRAGGIATDFCCAICTDTAGNCYITGMFAGTADYGTTSLTSAGGDDAYVAKLDTIGNWLWAVRGGGTSHDKAWNVAVDNNQDCYITGSFMGTASFGTFSLTSSGNIDIYAARLDASGQWLWASRAGGTSSEEGYGIGVDNAGNVYITGRFSGTADFYVNTLNSAGSDDIYVAKLDADGYFQWATQAGGPGVDGGYWLAVDDAGNCYLTGGFSLTASFGTTALTSQGNLDVMIAKVNTNGGWVWSKRAGGSAQDQGNGICVDASGGVYIAGVIFGSGDFGNTNVTCLGGWDAVAAKLDNDGNWFWVVHVGNTDNEGCFDVAACSGGYIYLSGVFSLTDLFGVTSLTSVGARDIWVGKLAPGVGIDDELAPEITDVSSLSDAWPNPFRVGNTATIKANIAERETGTLALFNLRGQCVATWPLSSGSHEIVISGNDLPAGIYLYQLNTPSTHAVKKLVLLK